MPKRNPAIKKYVSRGQTKYKFQVYLGQDENGKSINTTHSGFKSYAQASAAYNKLKAQGLAAKAPKKRPWMRFGRFGSTVIKEASKSRQQARR